MSAIRCWRSWSCKSSSVRKSRPPNAAWYPVKKIWHLNFKMSFQGQKYELLKSRRLNLLHKKEIGLCAQVSRVINLP